MTIKEVVDQLGDLLNNSKCSCVGTPHNPCPRCLVSIDLSKSLLEKAEKELEISTYL